MDKEEWLDRYLAEQEDLHRKLAETLARDTDAWGVSRCATSTGAADGSAERTPSS